MLPPSSQKRDYMVRNVLLMFIQAHARDPGLSANWSIPWTRRREGEVDLEPLDQWP